MNYQTIVAAEKYDNNIVGIIKTNVGEQGRVRITGFGAVLLH